MLDIKKIIFVLIAVMSFQAFASNKFDCLSESEGSQSVLKVESQIESASEISDVKVTIKSEDAAVFTSLLEATGAIEADPNYSPHNEHNRQYNRFELTQNGVDHYQLFLLKNLKLGSHLKFSARLRTAFDSGAGIIRRLNCKFEE